MNITTIVVSLEINDRLDGICCEPDVNDNDMSWLVVYRDYLCAMLSSCNARIDAIVA